MGISLISSISFSFAAKECEVCVKVIEDVRESMEKKDRNNKPKIEEALANYCSGQLGPRERKICYYIDPIKRDVSQPFSTGMPADRVLNVSIKLTQRFVA